MKSIRTIGLVGVGVVLTALMLAAQPAFSAPQQQDNQLRNGDFESGSYKWNGDGAREIPDEWAPFWEDSGAPPRYNLAESPQRVKTGLRAASFWEQYLDYDGGLFQIIPNVTPGNVYQFTAYGHAWSTTDASKGTSDTDVQMRIGIDPTGGDNPNSGNIVWSGIQSARDNYSLFSVQATATGTQITVWLRGKTTYPVTQTDFYWDSASLIITGQGAAPTKTPASSGSTGGTSGGGNTGGGGGGGCNSNSVPQGSIKQADPEADGSIIHTVKKCETLIGIAVTYNVTLEEIRQLNNLKSDVLLVGQNLTIRGPQAPPTPEPPTATPEGQEPPPTEAVAEVPPAEEAKGTICIMGYDDLNSNGIREPEEPKQAGITFAVTDGTQTTGTYTTDGFAEPYCFTDLTPGTYTVSWVGDTFTPTTEQTWVANVGPGATVSREFGVSSTGGAAADPEAGADGAKTGLPTWAVGLIAAIGVVLVLTGVGAAGYFLLIRRNQIS